MKYIAIMMILLASACGQQAPVGSEANPTKPNPSPTSAQPIPGGMVTNCSGNLLCLAVKYVSYNVSGVSVLDLAEAVANIQRVNGYWKQCGIEFAIEQFMTPNPMTSGLRSSPQTQAELDQIRAAYQDDKTLLVVQTTNWSGTLGASRAVAWTWMPGNDISGVVMNGSIATSPIFLAHELGHYLGLDHAASSNNVMYYAPYSSANMINNCAYAKQIAQTYWKAMVR